MSREPARYLTDFENKLHSDVVIPLSKMYERTGGAAGSSKLGVVKDFASLVLKAQRDGVPLWKTGSQNDARGRDARRAFARIGKNIIQKTMQST